MESWPSVLPDVSDETYSLDELSNTKRTDMDSGRVRQQQRFTANMNQVPVMWKMDDTQLAIFKAWHKFKISLGADFFNVDLDFGGSSLTTVAARFVDGRFNADWQKGHWYVTATLEVEEPPTISEEDLDEILGES